MNNVIEQMITKYEINNVNDEINALKEIIQEIVLAGLSRGNFFNNAAFYGGTALRIFYNLDRFSEDLDFALLEPNKDFDLSKYFIYIEKELKAYGINLEISTKQNTTLFKFSPINQEHSYNHLLKNLKIKFEVDINPPSGATFDDKFKLFPSPHHIKLFDKESLFASKIHTILYKPKGRDLYDYIFFLTHDTNVNIELLKNKLIASNYIIENEEFSIETIKKLLINKFKEIDYTDAKEDVKPFIKDVESLNIWNKEFFITITDNLKD